jgi:hypothetical protein
MEVGDCFEKKDIFQGSEWNTTFKITKILPLVDCFSSLAYECEVYLLNRKVSTIIELNNTLLKMRKLSKLEKELM